MSIKITKPDYTLFISVGDGRPDTIVEHTSGVDGHGVAYATATYVPDSSKVVISKIDAGDKESFSDTDKVKEEKRARREEKLAKKVEKEEFENLDDYEKVSSIVSENINK